MNFGDSHNRLETPGLIPNPEVKHPMLVAVVSYKKPNHQAVFHYIYNSRKSYDFMKKQSKTEAKNHISRFFQDIKNKSPDDIRKIKRLAMRYNIPLREKRKKLCKKCLAPYKNPKIRIKRKMKTTTCENCGYVARCRI